MIFGFVDSNGNKGQKSTITGIAGGRKTLVSRRDAEGAESLARFGCEARTNLEAKGDISFIFFAKMVRYVFFVSNFTSRLQIEAVGVDQGLRRCIRDDRRL